LADVSVGRLRIVVQHGEQLAVAGGQLVQGLADGLLASARSRSTEPSEPSPVRSSIRSRSIGSIEIERACDMLSRSALC
jgi:hypothetical protein